VGGPGINQRGTLFPVPLVSTGARYGVLPGVDVHGHLHLGALTEGGIGAGIGSTVLLLPQEGLKPAVSATGRAHAFTEFQRSFRPFGELAAHASWSHGARWMTYLGGSAVVDIGGQDDGLWSVGAGESVTLGPWTLQLELRAYQPSFGNEVRTIQFPLLLGDSPFGAVLGVGYRFGEESP
jgi:hypothetical protein